MNDQEHIIETFTEMASRYEKLMNNELTLFWGIDYYHFIQEVLGEITFEQSKNILDIATGTAFIPRYLIKTERFSKTITGLDITYQMLLEGRKRIAEEGSEGNVQMVCASAHAMPFKNDFFDVAICCLATHHMDVEKLLSEIYSSLKQGGKFHIGDVGGSAKWKIGLIRSLIKVLAFLYFLFAENFSRAKAESQAVANVMTSDEWIRKIQQQGFKEIKIREVKSGHFWTPNPVIIEAIK